MALEGSGLKVGGVTVCDCVTSCDERMDVRTFTDSDKGPESRTKEVVIFSHKKPPIFSFQKIPSSCSVGSFRVASYESLP